MKVQSEMTVQSDQIYLGYKRGVNGASINKPHLMKELALGRL